MTVAAHPRRRGTRSPQAMSEHAHVKAFPKDSRESGRGFGIPRASVRRWLRQGERDRGVARYPTASQRRLWAALDEASSTFWFMRPSWKFGCVEAPDASAWSQSWIMCVKLCS